MNPKQKPDPESVSPEPGPVKKTVNRVYLYGERHVATVAFVSLGLGVVLAVLVLLGFLRAHDVENKVTHIENSPCNAHPAGRKCQGIKERSDEKRSVSSACILFYKVDKSGQLLRLTKCPVEPRHQKQVEAGEHPDSASGPMASAQPKAGDASDAQPGHSQPAPGNGGSHGTPSHHHAPSVSGEQGSGGEAVPQPAPAKEASSTSSQSSSSSVERTTESTVVESAPAPVREGVGGLVEGVGAAVQETGATVNGTVEGVTGTTCTLAKLLCP